MKSTMRFAAKACLVTAATGLLSSQVAGLLAQDGTAPTVQPSGGSKVLQAQGYAPVTRASSVQPAPVQAAPEQESAVQKELRRLAAKNNRELPPMNIDEAPHTQGGPAAPGHPATGARPAGQAVASAAPAAPAPKANWFERTFHVGKGKRQPAPTAEHAAPAQPRSPGYKLTAPQTAARPVPQTNRPPIAAAPTYQSPPSVTTPVVTPPPVVAGPAASAAPAQPQLREPSPLAPSPAARELMVKAKPPTVRPARPKGDSKPLLDESDMGDDVESLDLDDNEPKVADKAPEILSNRGTAKDASESPYSGLTIAPNEEERQASSRPQPAPVAELADDDLSISEESSNPAPREAIPRTAAKPITEELAAPAEKPAHSKSAVAKSKTGLAPLDDDDDEDDEDDDDEDMLSLPSAKAGNKPRTLSEPAVLKAAKVLEKMGTPLAPVHAAAPIAAAPTAAAPVAAPVATAELPAAAPVGAPVVTAPAAPAVDAAPEAAPAAPVFSGLKGICPVALKDSRKLIDARPTIVSTYKGKTYAFSSVEAKQAFDEFPQKYAPAGGGTDVVKHTAGEKSVEGSLEHAAWYRGRLYLFSTAESRHEFVDAPSKFVIED